jgi:hypothetical protein
MGYRGSTRGGVPHVRTVGQPPRVTEILTRRIELDAASDVPAVEAIGSRIRNAVRGSGSDGLRGSDDSSGASQPVTIRGGSTTVRQALDDVVRQVPGLVWYLTFPPNHNSSYVIIGLFDGPGGVGTSLLRQPDRACAAPCGE